MSVPARFLFSLRDERILRLMKGVWRRLPAHDQAVLRALVLDVSDGAGCQEPENVLAHAGAIDPDLCQNGIAARAAEDVTYTVWLGRAREVKSDQACMLVIAHEFAHVVLRHSQMACVVEVLAPFGEPYGQAEIAQLREWHEDDANLQAWVWGFQDELRAFMEEYPESRRSRWYVELEWDGTQ